VEANPGGEKMVMGPSPKISVVIFTYNFASYLRECIESVLAQTLLPSEIVICDDHSIDNSWKIIREYSQQYPDLIKSHIHKRNMGAACNGNFGLRRAKRDLMAWLDGDDRWLPRKLEKEWKALQRYPEARIAYSNVYTIDDAGNRTGIWYDGRGPVPPSGDVFVEVFSRRFFPNTRSVFRNQLMYRSTVEEVGYNDKKLESYWDWDRKIRLTARFPVVYSGEALVEYRNHNEGLSHRDPEKHFRGMMDVYEKNLPLLAQRSLVEVTRVRCHIESLLALRQINLPLPERLDYYSAHNMYKRNRILLGRLPENDRMVLEKELSTVLESLAWQAAREGIDRGDRRLAFKYWIEVLGYNSKSLNLNLAAQIMLPRWGYSRLKAVYCGLRDIRHSYLERF
jgi:glycosyltransferase involved in cell wall biosynthesis